MMKLLEKRSKNLIYNKEVIAVFFSAGFISFASVVYYFVNLLYIFATNKIFVLLMHNICTVSSPVQLFINELLMKKIVYSNNNFSELLRIECLVKVILRFRQVTVFIKTSIAKINFQANF